MANLLPSITNPPTYLTRLWKQCLVISIQNSLYLPDVEKDSGDPTRRGRYLDKWQKFNDLMVQHNNHYFIHGGYTWEYDFTFSWDVAQSVIRK